MKIEQAKALKSGDKVNFPTDRGSPAGFATVRTFNGKGSHAECTINKNNGGTDYIWVQTDKGVWPSNRIERGIK